MQRDHENIKKIGRKYERESDLDFFFYFKYMCASSLHHFNYVYFFSFCIEFANLKEVMFFLLTKGIFTIEATSLTSLVFLTTFLLCLENFQKYLLFIRVADQFIFFFLICSLLFRHGMVFTLFYSSTYIVRLKIFRDFFNCLKHLSAKV